MTTLEDLYRLPDDGRVYELTAGRLVSEPLPSPRHGRVTAAVAERLRRFVRNRDLGVVLSNDAGYVLARSPDTMRGPDVSFVARSRYGDAADRAPAFPGPPDLAVEVLSPHNRPAEIGAKIADYLAAGTRLIWVVDPEAERVEVHGPGRAPRVVGKRETLDGEDVLPGLRFRVGTLFEY